MISDPATDAEMRAMAEAERDSLTARRGELAQGIRVALLPKDAMDDRNVVLEIRAGTGGDEAALFAGDLFRMYQRYAELQGWKVRGDLRRAKAPSAATRKSSPRSQGRGVFAKLKFESGVHRVQRVPDDRNAGAHPHLGRDRRRVAGGRGCRRRDQDRRSARRDDARAAAPAASTSTRPNRRSASPTSDRHRGDDARTAARSTRIGRPAMNVLRSRIYDAERQRVDATRSAERREQVGSGDRSRAHPHL